MRLITIEDDKLKKVLAERGRVLTEARKITKEVERLQKEQQKLGYKLERLKDNTKPLMEYHRIDVAEFEIVSRVFLDEKTGEPTAEVIDQIEEYKNFLREEKNKPKKSGEYGN